MAAQVLQFAATRGPLRMPAPVTCKDGTCGIPQAAPSAQPVTAAVLRDRAAADDSGGLLSTARHRSTRSFSGMKSVANQTLAVFPPTNNRRGCLSDSRTA